jgi:peptidoglycan/LPS O-acetylase OafA/YrhL
MGKIRELDGLRGLLAVWVVCVHLLASAGVSPRTFGFFAPLFGEHLRVEVFCILSGFVIFLMLSQRPQGYGAFLAGRLWRLYPVFLLAFVLSVMMAPLALEAVRGAPFGGLRNETRTLILEEGLRNLPAHVLAHVTLLHGIVPTDVLPYAAYTFLGQAWNISTEVQFYLVAPLLFAGLAGAGALRRAAIWGLCGLFWLALRDWPNPANLALYFPYFAGGILSFHLWRRDWHRIALLTPLSVTGLALAVFAGVDMAAGLWVFVLGWLLLARDRGAGRAVGWLASPPLRWLGMLSYPLYLMHMIPLYLGMYLLNDLGLDRAAYLGALTAITFTLALPLSWATALWVEQRFQRASPSARPVQPAE